MDAGEQKTRLLDIPDDFPVFRYVVYHQTTSESYRKHSDSGLYTVFLHESGLCRLRRDFQRRDDRQIFRPGTDEMVLRASQLSLDVRQPWPDVLFHGYF